MIKIKTENEIKKMEVASSIISDLLFLLEDKYIKPGVNTLELDKVAENYIIEKGAIPGFKGLYGFPATLCISINDEVVHGIPSKRRLKDGDIVGIDVGAIYEGYYGDHARTFPVGNVNKAILKLMNVTKECLKIGIDKAKPGNRIGDIGFAIQTYAEENGYGVVRELVGHGIGEKLHEEPQIPNFGKPNTGPLIEKGMCFAIEPMINLGTKDVYTKDDNWTICTKDGLPSAHFEHTITVGDHNSRILTN